MGDKRKKPSEMTAAEIAKIRDTYSTKALMGEGKPKGNIIKKAYQGVRNVIKQSEQRTKAEKAKEMANRKAMQKGKK